MIFSLIYRFFFFKDDMDIIIDALRKAEVKRN